MNGKFESNSNDYDESNLNRLFGSGATRSADSIASDEIRTSIAVPRNRGLARPGLRPRLADELIDSIEDL